MQGATKRPNPLPRWILFMVLALAAFPLWQYLIWYLTPIRPIKLLIVDKTSLTREQPSERNTLNWVLRHGRYGPNPERLYDLRDDFWGFVPTTGTQYQLKGLEHLSRNERKQLLAHTDAAYFCDTYGVYQQDWSPQPNLATGELSPLLYGGLSPADLEAMQSLYQAGKPIIGEFNLVADPTSPALGEAAAKLFGFRPTGWTGRYIHQLRATDNPDLPGWLPRLYQQQTHQPWKFEGSGLILVHRQGRVLVFPSQQTPLVPQLVTDTEAQQTWGIPAVTPYPFWFEIITASPDIPVISHLTLPLESPEELQTLAKANIPLQFPAVIGTLAPPHPRFYFAADFADNPVPLRMSHFYGIWHLRFLFYNRQDPEDRRQFFWEYYQPLMHKIFDRIQKNR
jgi:hypothetical protein